jgi:hypothetical protein|tara:strand:+ start:870 stop:1268 length:399 start_codon:yes stop_codon:yes gene_type:complete
MTLLTQSVITEEDVMLNHIVRYVQFVPSKLPPSNLIQPNHLLVRYKKYLSSISEEDFYQEDMEEVGIEKMKEDFKKIEDELNRSEIVVYSPRDCLVVEESLIEFSTEKMRSLFIKEWARLHDKHYNKHNFWT